MAQNYLGFQLSAVPVNKEGDALARIGRIPQQPEDEPSRGNRAHQRGGGFAKRHKPFYNKGLRILGINLR